jgi:E2/UBC family protein E/multiubiquitin
MDEQDRESNALTEESVEIADLEALAKSDKKPPKAKKYRIRIDKEYLVVEKPGLTGKELLILAGKQPECFDIFQIIRKNPKPQKIGLDEYIDFTCHGIERFVTLPKEQKDGRDARMNFSLPADDAEFLCDKSFRWEALSENGLKWVIIYEYPLPEGYNVAKVEIALQITPSYPATEIDMAYFYPQLARKTGGTIHALSYQSIDGKIFQRWSRHRNPGEWRPGLDNISTHLLLVDNWLEKEIKR